MQRVLQATRQLVEARQLLQPRQLVTCARLSAHRPIPSPTGLCPVAPPTSKPTADQRSDHESKPSHRDLNLGNILVVGGSGEPAIAFVDLDRASLDSKPVGPWARRRALARLARSARKLDPEGRIVGEAFLAAVERAYADVA